MVRFAPSKKAECAGCKDIYVKIAVRNLAMPEEPKTNPLKNFGEITCLVNKHLGN